MVFRAVSPGGQAKKTKLQELLTGLEAQADTCWLPRAVLHKFFQGELGFCRTPICSRWLAGPIQGSSLLLLGFLRASCELQPPAASRRPQAETTLRTSAEPGPSKLWRRHSCLPAGLSAEAKQDVAKSEKAFEAEHFWVSEPGCSLARAVGGEDIRKDYERLSPGVLPQRKAHRFGIVREPEDGKKGKRCCGPSM